MIIRDMGIMEGEDGAVGVATKTEAKNRLRG